MKASILIIQPEAKQPIEVNEITQRLNTRFDNYESFTQRLDIHCLDISRELGCTFRRETHIDGNQVNYGDGWVLVFDFTNGARIN